MAPTMMVNGRAVGASRKAQSRRIVIAVSPMVCSMMTPRTIRPVMRYCSCWLKPRSSSTTSMTAMTVTPISVRTTEPEPPWIAGAADQHRSDGGVVVAGAELHVARAVARGEQHAGDRRAGAGDDVGDGDGGGGVDAGGGRGARIAADHRHQRGRSASTTG